MVVTRRGFSFKSDCASFIDAKLASFEVRSPESEVSKSFAALTASLFTNPLSAKNSIAKGAPSTRELLQSEVNIAQCKENERVKETLASVENFACGQTSVRAKRVVCMGENGVGRLKKVHTSTNKMPTASAMVPSNDEPPK